METNPTTSDGTQEESFKTCRVEPANSENDSLLLGASSIDTSTLPAHHSMAETVSQLDSEISSRLPASSSTTAAVPFNNNNQENIAEQAPVEPAIHLAAVASASIEGSSTHTHSEAADTMDASDKSNRKKKRKRPIDDSLKTSGRWTQEEHEAFLKGLATYGREWKRVAQHIATRTSAQVRSHAQKYLRKQEQMLLTQSQQHLQSNGSNGDWYGYLGNHSSSVNDHDEDTASNLSHGDSLDHDGNGGAYHHRHLYEPASASLQLHVDRIIAQPHAVAQQVQDTLAALHDRYRDLQMQMRNMSVQPAANGPPPDAVVVALADGSTDHSTIGSGSSYHEQHYEETRSRSPSEQELIALHVLHRKLSSSTTESSSIQQGQLQAVLLDANAARTNDETTEQRLDDDATKQATADETDKNLATERTVNNNEE
ncbi:hypothetical protein MPSEU_000560100 [Mayamaea pseudoterrestris]|nr:hypothetical protein MPSEU_000560100 [Mayamaea pseudoterrestris]